MVLYADDDAECMFRNHVKKIGSVHGDLKKHTSAALKEYVLKHGDSHE